MGLPLEGVKVLDLSRLLPGGFCSLLLADLGADVLKVEDTGAGDYLRWAPPYYQGAERSTRSASFLALNRNKRSIRLNLKSEEGRDVLLRLVKQHDVLLESFRPGVLEKLGVGYERMKQVNKRIVCCAISGYGQDGPKRHSAGHDMNYLGLNGLLGLTGERDGPPIQAAGQIADIGGGALMAAVGILAALRERDGGGEGADAGGSGEGQLVDISMTDGALSWLALVAGGYFADGVLPRRGDLPLSGALICYRPYECRDGWMTLGALEPKFWRAWCEGVGREDLIERQFEGPGSEAHREVVAIFKQRTVTEWQQFASEHDCCLERVLKLDEALSSELVSARKMVVEIEQDGIDGRVRQLGIPLKLSRTEGDVSRLQAPALGQHTEEVLRDLGFSGEEIDGMLERGAAAGPQGDDTAAGPQGDGATAGVKSDGTTAPAG